MLKCYGEPASFSTQVKNRCYEHVFSEPPPEGGDCFFSTSKTHLFLFLPALLPEVEDYNSIVNSSFDESHRASVILLCRFGGSAPGVSPIAAAAYLAAAIHFEDFVCEWKGRIEIGPTNPYGLFSLVDRIKSRNSLPRDLHTETEKALLSASERINEAAVNHPHGRYSWSTFQRVSRPSQGPPP